MARLIKHDLYDWNYTDEKFRAWCGFIDELFMLGMINVTDAGQMDLSTVAHPLSGDVSSGYKIYQTNDALTPVFFKVEFGGYYSPTLPCIWMTISTAYTVGGTMGGRTLLARTQMFTQGPSETELQTCMGSAGPNRICFAMFTDIATAPFWFSFERRKNSSLEDVDTGVLIDWGESTNQHYSLCAPFEGPIPVQEYGFQFILTTLNPGVYGSEVPVGLRIPCLGPSEAPGKNIGFCNAADFGDFAEPMLTLGTEEIAFKHCGPNIHSLRGANTTWVDSHTRLLLRFD